MKLFLCTNNCFLKPALKLKVKSEINLTVIKTKKKTVQIKILARSKLFRITLKILILIKLIN
jgi:hypothetical protein